MIIISKKIIISGRNCKRVIFLDLRESVYIINFIAATKTSFYIFLRKTIKWIMIFILRRGFNPSMLLKSGDIDCLTYIKKCNFAFCQWYETL